MKPPGSRTTNPTTKPRTRSPWFRHAPLADARRPAQPTSRRTKLVEPGREERAARVETTRHPNNKPNPRPRPPSPRFQHAPLANARRPAQPTSRRTKPVEPARERSERLSRNHPATGRQTRPQHPDHPHHGFDTTHSLTLAGRLNQLQEGQSRLSRDARNERPESKPPRYRSANPTTRPRPPPPWFRHDPLADARRPAQPTSERTKPVEPGREERAARVETPDTRTTNPTQDPDHPHHGFNTTHSLTLAGRLNQLDSGWSRHDQLTKQAGRLNQLLLRRSQT